MSILIRPHLRGLLIIATCLVVTLVACGGSAGGPTSALPSLARASSDANLVDAQLGDHIKVGMSPLVANAGIFIGINHGYFRDLGLNVESVPFAVPAEMAAPLAAGQIDIANASLATDFLNAAARGVQIRLVADGSHSAPGHSAVALVIRKDLVDSGQVKSFADLKGLRLSGILSGSGPDLYLHGAMALGSLTDADVQVEYLSFDASLTAMAGNALDGAIEAEPFVTAAVDRGIGVVLKRSADVAGATQDTVIMFSPEMAAHRQDVGRRFVVDYLRAIRDYTDALTTGRDMDAIVGLLARNTEIKDPRLFDRVELPVFDVNGQMDVNSMAKIQQQYIANKYVPVAVDLSTLIDTSYLDYATRQLGRR